MKFLIFLIFPNFLSRVGAREAVCIYQFFANNHGSFHLWLKENLLNHQEVSQHYEHGCSCIVCK